MKGRINSKVLVSALLIVLPAAITAIAGLIWETSAILSLLGLAGSVIVAVNRLQGGDSGGGISVDKFVERLADGEFGEALTEARESFQLSAEAEESITSMKNRGHEQATSASNIREILEGMGMTLVNLSETLTNQASAIEEVTQTSELSTNFFTFPKAVRSRSVRAKATTKEGFSPMALSA